MPYIGRSEKFGVRNRFYYTQASGGATSISGNDDAGKGLSFTDGAYVDVALNGVTLVAGTDYNTTTANTIAGLSALSAGDIIEILVYDVFNVADTVSASSGGTFSGGVTINGNLTVTGSGAGAAGVVSASTSGTAISIDSSNRVTMPSQPAFNVNPASAQSNFAVGSHVTVVFGTEVIDRNADFASNTFNAPVTGLYQLNATLYLENVDSASPYYQIRIVTSNRSYEAVFDPDFGQDAVYWNICISALADMDASDTAIVTIKQGSGAAQTDINTASAFSGFLAC